MSEDTAVLNLGLTIEQAHDRCPTILASVRDAYPDGDNGTVEDVLETVLQWMVPRERAGEQVPLSRDVIVLLREQGEVP